MKPDDDTIDSADIAHRWLSGTDMLLWDEGEGAFTAASSGAFDFHEDGCSVYLRSLLAKSNLGPADLIRQPATDVVLSVSVANVRDADLGVAYDIDPPDAPDHPRNKAHALVVKPDDMGSKRLVRARRAVARASTITMQP